MIKQISHLNIDPLRLKILIYTIKTCIWSAITFVDNIKIVFIYLVLRTTSTPFL